MKRLLVLCGILLLVLFLSVGCDGGTAEEPVEEPESEDTAAPDDSETETAEPVEPINIKAIHAWTEGSAQHDNFVMFKDLVEEKSNGSITVEFIGGSEVFSPQDHGEATRNGVVDMAMGVGSYHSSVVPETIATYISGLTVAEQEEKGATEWLRQLYIDRVGVYMIPQEDYTQGFAFYMAKPVETIEDFKGLSIRGSSSYQPAIEAVGASVATIPTGDVYAALERGVVDGTGWPNTGFVEYSLHEVVKQKIQPYWFPSGFLWVINLDFWNGLTDEQRTIIEDSLREGGLEYKAWCDDKEEEENQILRDSGVEIYEMPEADRFLEMIYASGWEKMDNLAPDNAEKMRELFID